MWLGVSGIRSGGKRYTLRLVKPDTQSDCGLGLNHRKPTACRAISQRTVGEKTRKKEKIDKLK